jgi:hypothetical protein
MVIGRTKIATTILQLTHLLQYGWLTDHIELLEYFWALSFRYVTIGHVEAR